MSTEPGSHEAYVQRMRLRRRQMLQAAAVGGSVGMVAFLNACAAPAATPTAAPAPAAPAAPAATQPPAPTAAPPTATTAPPTATTAPATATAVPATATAAPPTATPVPNLLGATAVAGAFLLNLGGENDTNDPGRASFINEIEVVMRVFSNSYTFDAKAQLVLDQAMAMPAVSADGKTITVKLKPGLVWSDGKALSAKDFVYGALRQLSPVVAGDYAFTLYALAGGSDYNSADPSKVSAADLQKMRDAVGVSAPDDTTIVYKLQDPAPWFLSVLATWNGLPVRQDLITQGGAAEDNQDWTKDPARYIGNGPYTLTKWDQGVQYVFTANPKYVRGEPPTKTIQFVQIKDNAVAFQAYKAGQLDRTAVGPLIIDAVKADPVLSKEFVKVGGSCSFYLGFNNTVPPFDNMKVRQAFSMAIDRQTLADQVFKGLALPADQFLPPTFPGNYSDIPPQKFDAAGAASLLSDAGFPGGKGLPPVKFTFSSSDTNKLVSQATQAMIQTALGVAITLDPVDPKAFTALTKKQETVPQMFRLGWCQDYPDPQDWYSTVFQSSSTVSHTGWKSDKFDSLTKAADIEIDPKKRDDMYRQAATILNTETPVAFSWYDTASFLIKSRVQGMKVDPFEYFVGQHSLYDLKLGS